MYNIDNSYGTLYLIPIALNGENPDAVIPKKTLELIATLDTFVVETPKTARKFLAQVGLKLPLQNLQLLAMDEHSTPREIAESLVPLKRGKNLGLMSDAGCPAIADPGAALVRLAHENAVRVVPLVGPSSIFLALMASGLNGQRFMFHGYLPAKTNDRERAISKLERESRSGDLTQIFIETPYRNLKLFESLVSVCDSRTWLCIATDITLVSERIQTRRVRDWKSDLPEIDHRPTVFLLYAAKV